LDDELIERLGTLRGAVVFAHADYLALRDIE
jgi:hypothetical protein